MTAVHWNPSARGSFPVGVRLSLSWYQRRFEADGHRCHSDVATDASSHLDMNWGQRALVAETSPPDQWRGGMMEEVSLGVHSGKVVYRVGIYPVVETGDGESRDRGCPRHI